MFPECRWGKGLEIHTWTLVEVRMLRRSVDQLTAAVSRRLDFLLEKPFEDIAALPSHSSEDLAVDGRKTTLSVWHEALSSGEHLIAVQVYRPWLLGIGRMYVDGFVVDAQNQRRPLTQDEWAPFS